MRAQKHQSLHAEWACACMCVCL